MTAPKWEQSLKNQLQQWHADGLARELKTSEHAGVRLKINGRDVISFASNDYLGLANHPALIAAAKTALDRSGAGSCASPLIVGHRSEHSELESVLAKFKQSEAALVFSSGYQAAVATLSSIATNGDTVILDRLAHASLIDGAKLSGARVRAFKHNDVADLRRLLAAEQNSESPESKTIIAIESLYSMDGDAAPLDEILGLSVEFHALLLIDEAHATGVFGEHGRGLLEAITTKRGGLPKNVLAMGTLSKALGSQGGYLCASKLIIDTIVHSGRAYLFSTALAPAAAAAALAGLKLIDAEPQRRRAVLESSDSVRAELTKMKFEIVPSNGPIIPVLAGVESKSTEWSRQLFEHGIFVPAVRYPTVKKGQARLRISLSAAHSRADCEELLKAFAALKSSPYKAD